MDITSTKPTPVSHYSNLTTVNTSRELGKLSPKSVSNQELVDQKLSSDPNQKEDSLTDEDVNNLTDNLNKFFEYLNADLRFEIHEGTERLMVKLVSKKDQTVLKEIPPQELLDTIAAIQDHVGMLLDKQV